MATMMFAGSVPAAQAATPIGGATSKAALTPKECGGAGGGTWCHGTEPTGLSVRCFSNYKHDGNYHSSTAVLGNATDTRYAKAGYWSMASATDSWVYTCYAYYNDEVDDNSQS